MPKSSHTRIPLAKPAILAAALAVFALSILTGCGSDASNGEGGPHPNYEKALAGSPPPLAALHKQSDELLDGGTDAFDARMAELKGFPAVVNIWASWCGPCRAEFAHFQDAAANMGRKVAFLGVNPSDSSDLAQEFLDDNPVPYPSYSDPDREISDNLDATHGFPATAFFDSNGDLTYTKTGAYTSQEELEADVKTHAIDGDSG